MRLADCVSVRIPHGVPTAKSPLTIRRWAFSLCINHYTAFGSGNFLPFRIAKKVNLQ